MPFATFQRNTVLNEAEMITLVLKPYISQMCIASITKTTNDLFLLNIKDHSMILDHVFFMLRKIIVSLRPTSQTRCASFEDKQAKQWQ